MRHIFQALVADDQDVPGALAYFIYKRSKIEWRAGFPGAHNGAQPNAADEAEFVVFCMLPENLGSLKQRGADLAAGFVAKAMERKITAIALDATRSELAIKFAALENNVTSSLKRIENRFEEKKSWRAWGKDIVTALISGLGVILAVGLLFNGYTRFAMLNTAAEKSIGIEVETQQQKIDRRNHAEVPPAPVNGATPAAAKLPPK